MNYDLIILEIAVVVLGLGILLADLWTPAEQKRKLGCFAATVLGLILIGSFAPHTLGSAFNNMYVLDGLALFFKRFFLLAAIIVMILSGEFSDRIDSATSAFSTLQLFALSLMMFAL